jgi:1-deoxy-D-xylulose-5-phosphate reductoisomerase
MNRLAILGSTGSIGRQTLDVVAAHGDKFKVVALSANDNVELLKAQAEKFAPELIAISNAAKASDFDAGGNELVVGEDAPIAACTRDDVDTVVLAISGIAALKPLLAAIKAGKRIACANKESIVCGGTLVIRALQKSNATLLPVDSEQSAIFQCLQNVNKSDVGRLIITASGGALRNFNKQELELATAEQALRHPNWSMGKKITVDSATLANKGLEIMEASYLFDLPHTKIDVVVHTESVIHSLVELIDGSMLAQLSMPDMRLPIQYALTYPEHIACSIERLDLAKLGRLTFTEPDTDKFPALKLAYDAMNKGAAGCIAYNGANEVAVELFLANKLRFYDIAEAIELALDECNGGVECIEDILELDALARRIVTQRFNK